MKKIGILLIGVLIASILVSADSYVDIDVNTDKDLYASIDLNSGDDMEIWIDGINYNDEQESMHQEIVDSSRPMSSIFSRLSEVFISWDNRVKKWKYTQEKDLEYGASKLKFALDNYFVTRQEYNNDMAYLNLEIETLKSFMDEKQICLAKIELAKRFDFDSIQCNKITYFQGHDGEFYELKEPEKTQEEIDEEEFQKLLLKYVNDQESQKELEKQFNNTKSYIDLICPNGHWTKGKCMEMIE